jgi:hypothetical protein
MQERRAFGCTRPSVQWASETSAALACGSCVVIRELGSDEQVLVPGQGSLQGFSCGGGVLALSSTVGDAHGHASCLQLHIEGMRPPPSPFFFPPPPPPPPLRGCCTPRTRMPTPRRLVT